MAGTSFAAPATNVGLNVSIRCRATGPVQKDNAVQSLKELLACLLLAALGLGLAVNSLGGAGTTGRAMFDWRCEFWVLRLLLTALISCVGFGARCLAAESDVILVGVGILRAHAVTAGLPPYPRSSLAAGHKGIAVVEVQVSESGEVTLAHILEAPDPAIGSAVEATVRCWTFRPFLASSDKKHFAARSRLIFYFRLIEGKPVVVDAAAGLVAGRAE
jgi:TonB family protein